MSRKDVASEREVYSRWRSNSCQGCSRPRLRHARPHAHNARAMTYRQCVFWWRGAGANRARTNAPSALDEVMADRHSGQACDSQSFVRLGASPAFPTRGYFVFETHSACRKGIWKPLPLCRAGRLEQHTQYHAWGFALLLQATQTLPGRLELPTLRLTASRSNQLSYGSLRD